ncbi:hypothetical protein [Acidisarcina polymorpha]
MRRFPGFAGDDVPTILWEDDSNPDSWKDFVEMAKTASASFLTMSEVILEKEDLEILIEHLGDQDFSAEDGSDVHDVEFLVSYVGKLGYIQLGFAHQGVVYIHENSTPWYDRYQQMLEAVESFSDILLETGGDEDEES